MMTKSKCELTLSLNIHMLGEEPAASTDSIPKYNGHPDSPVRPDARCLMPVQTQTMQEGKKQTLNDGKEPVQT